MLFSRGGPQVADCFAMFRIARGLNEDAFAAWMFRIKPDNPADFDTLLSAADYEKTAAA